jgi:hypothetical protein
LLRCLYVEHGEEQHLKENSDLNVEVTPYVHVKIKIEQGFTIAFCSKFYTSLVSLYNLHQYPFDHMWNNNEIGV